MADKNTGKGFSEDELKSLLSHEIRSAINYDESELSQKRSQNIEYYFGEMRDLPAPPNRSSVVDRTVADTIGWLLPSIIRTFTASGRIVEYEPKEPEDEEAADQASDYVNYVFYNENDGYRTLYTAVHDALLHGNGIVKVWWDDTPEYKISNHSGLTEQELAQLLQPNDDGEEPEVLTQDTEEQIIQDPMSGESIPVEVYSVKIRRLTRKGRLRLMPVAPEDFLMDKDAITIPEARFVCHRNGVTRSELVEMGFDRQKVESIPTDNEESWSQEEVSRNEDRFDFDDSKDETVQKLHLYECYVQTDVDDDGIAETVRAYYAGAQGTGELLEWEVWDDEVPLFDIPCEPVPHRFDGISIADQTVDMQRIRTAISRQTLDNLYLHNNPQPVVQEDDVINPDALVGAKFGQPIILRSGSEGIGWTDTPFIGDKALQVLEYTRTMVESRTGVSRTTMALDPETLQNQTATAAQLQKDQAYSKAELIARNQAEMGWKPIFRAVLKIITKHQDKPVTIRLRNEWHQVDPRHWNADMDCEINVGLGTGSRDRDMAMLQNLLQLQEGLAIKAAEMGAPQLALEMLPKIIDTGTKIGESAGIRNADSYFPEVGEEEMQAIRQMIEQQAAQPDPKLMADMQIKSAEMQQEMQLAQLKLQQEMQMKQADMERETQRERAQMEADLTTRQQEAELKAQEQMRELELKYKAEEQDYDIDLQKLQLEKAKLEQMLMIERAKIKASLVGKGEVEFEGEGLSFDDLFPDKTPQIMEAIERLNINMNSPKQVVRDENGRVIGVQGAGGYQQVIRDENGKIIGSAPETMN